MKGGALLCILRERPAALAAPATRARRARHVTAFLLLRCPSSGERWLFSGAMALPLAPEHLRR